MDLGSVGFSRSSQDVASPVRGVWSWTAIAILFALATLGNLYVIPGNHIVSALFAIEILLGAVWYSSRTTVFISVIAISLYIVTASIDRQPFLVGLFGITGLLLVAYLAVDLNRERYRSRATTRQLSLANEQLKLSEERLRVGLSMANVTVYNQDLDFRYTGVFTPIPGLASEAVIGKTEFDMLPESHARELQAFKRQVIDSGVGVREDRSLTLNGVTRIYDMRVEPLRDHNGKITGITGSSIDITERKRAEETRFFEATILSNIRDSVIATDLDGLVTFWNRGAEQLFGYSSSEVLNLPLSVLSPEKDPAKLTAYRDRILAGEEYNGEILECAKDGQTVWVDLKISALRNAQNQPIGFLRVASDITDRKQLESEREELLKRESNALHQLQQFVALVAHDLDQPLTTIHGVTQLLERSMDDRLSEPERRRLRSVRLATQRMSRLTGDLRQAIAIGSGHFTVNPEPMDLMQAILWVVNEQQNRTRQHEVVLNGPAKLMGNWDRDRVVQMLTNLVSNAIKYSPDGGEIDVSVIAEPESVTIQVRDSGIGMTEQQTEQLFEPFSRVHDDLRISGTGLGLYITRGIAEAHGGQISVQSVPGAGSTFIVTMPRQAHTASAA